MTINRVGLLAGVAFGFLLVGSRMTDYDVIHSMLLFRDLQPFLIMGSAVAVAAPSLWILQRRMWVAPLGGPLRLEPSPIGRHHVLGSVLFGAGWAVAGTCPGPALAMIGAGQLPGAFVVTGIFIGIVLRDAVVSGVVQTTRPVPSVMEPMPAGL